MWALLELAMRSAAGHRVMMSREAPPDMFVAAPIAGGGVGVALAESVEACVGAEGTVRLFPLAAERDGTEDPFRRMDCRQVRALDAPELSVALEGRGRRTRGGAPPPLEKPIVDGARGFAAFPGEWIPVQYFIRVTADHIQLIRWSSGNHWGTEVEHTYRVVVSGNGQRIVTARSVQRDVELD